MSTDIDPQPADINDGSADEGDAAQAAGPDWLDLANRSYSKSTDFYKSNLFKQWADNIALFQSRHPAGSLYHSEAYRSRSRLFRPKTRASARRGEAAVAAAFFSTAELCVIEPSDDNDPRQRAAASTMQEVMQYRLEKTIPWFLTLVGAWQDTRNMGLCCSRQRWIYEERVIAEHQEPVMGVGVAGYDPATNAPIMGDVQQIDPVTGQPMFRSVFETELVRDQPDISLVPLENVRFDPSSTWTDPVNSSPYFIVEWPMYVGDVRQKMTVVDPKTGSPPWKPMDEDRIAQARERDWNSVRDQRQAPRTPSELETRAVRDHDIVWVREVFVRHDGVDMTYWTLGDQGLLTDPIPTEQACGLKGGRNYVIGMSTLEAHNPFPQGMTALTSSLQVLTNRITNQRIDNVALAMNARNYVKRGRNVDLDALRRNAPGSTVLMDDPVSDVVSNRAPEVTASAYQENDRASIDFDELAGIFSGASVQQNRALNETVGGMQLLSGDASAVAEYDIRVFTLTWVEPVLRQLLQLEQKFESDEVVIGLAGKRAGVMETITATMLQQDLHLSVNVGIGATNPMQKLQRFKTAAETVGGLVGEKVSTAIQPEEVVSEVFGALGYRNGNRFFNFETDPQVAALQKQVEELKKALQSQVAPVEAQQRGELQRALIEEQGDTERQKMKSLTDMMMQFAKADPTFMQMMMMQLASRAAPMMAAAMAPSPSPAPPMLPAG